MSALYFLSLPFVSAFNVSQIFVIPLMVGLLAITWAIVRGGLVRLPLIQLDKLVLLFLISVLISVVVNVNTMDAKNLNHTLAIFAGYIIFYYGAERFSQWLSIEKILRLLFIGYVVTLVFCIVEFLIVNFTSYDINSIVFRPAVEDYTPGFLEIILIRSRSTFEESGYFAAYLGMMAPIMVYYLWHLQHKYWPRIMFIVGSALAYFMSFSVSLFIFLPIAIAITTLMRMLVERRINLHAITTFLLLLLGLIALSSTDLFDVMILRKFEGFSFQDRSDRFAATIDLFVNAGLPNMLFGHGPGSYFNLNIQPAVSVYLNFLRDFGLFGLMAYLAISVYALFGLLLARDALGQALFLSYLVTLLFFISTPIYFLPHYYLPLLFYRLRILRNKKLYASINTSAAKIR
jgi:hypothetical protein